MLENESSSKSHLVSIKADPLMWIEGEKIANSLHITKLSNVIERPVMDSDFVDNVVFIEKNINCLHRLLLEMINVNAPKNVYSLDSHMKSFIVSTLILCGEQSSKECFTSSITLEVTKDIQLLLCKLFQIGTEHIFRDFETKWDVNVCKYVLAALRSKLQKDIWKQYPAAMHCYRWLLLKMNKEQISKNIEDILLPTLLAIDDCEINNKILGITCLSHIMRNLSRTDLCSIGYDVLIYDALVPLVYMKEPEIITCVVPCVIQFLQKVEKGYTRKEDTQHFTRYDKVLKIILNNMEMEQYLDRRKAYIGVLGLYLDSMGLPMIRWSKQLMRIFEDYLFVDDGSSGVSTIKALEALQVYILHTWPLIPEKMDKLLEILLKLLIEMTDLDPSRVISKETLKEILNLIEKCLILVINTSPCKAKKLCAGLQESLDNDLFNEIIGRIFIKVNQ